MGPVRDESVNTKKNDSSGNARLRRSVSNRMEEQISIEDFAKIDLRVGEIKAVALHPDADKLLVLHVDIGEEPPRIIVAGIAPYVSDPQTLVGTQCCVVANLAPRMLRGIESQGMLLAAASGAHFSLISPLTEVPKGTHLH